MAKIKYRKLVRDKIPEIILAEGSSLQTKTLHNNSMIFYLTDKLVEEANELFDTKTYGDMIEEIADVMSVIARLLDFVDYNDVHRVMTEKYATKGGFNDNILLLWVDKGDSENE